MILADHQIESLSHPSWGKPLISPFKPEHLQPNSVDLTLDQIFLVPVSREAVDLGDVAQTVGEHERTVAPVAYTLPSQTFVLGSTSETIRIPGDLVGTIEGKSSLARLGLLVHVTAGWIDSGFEGKITLELFNLSRREIILRPGLKICQVSFAQCAHVRKPYGHPDLGSKYQGQRETTGSLYQA